MDSDQSQSNERLPEKTSESVLTANTQDQQVSLGPSMIRDLVEVQRQWNRVMALWDQHFLRCQPEDPIERLKRQAAKAREEIVLSLTPEQWTQYQVDWLGFALNVNLPTSPSPLAKPNSSKSSPEPKNTT